MNCPELLARTNETWDAMNTEGDMVINLGDNLTAENKDWLFTVCDSTKDENITICELHECVIYVENVWRLENCPHAFPQVKCEFE